MSKTIKLWFGKFIQFVFRKIGYSFSIKKLEPIEDEISIPGKYFNNGKDAYSQNTSKINDFFYSDKQSLELYYRGERIKFYENIIDLIKSKSWNLNDKSVLDAGCGSGHLMFFIKKNFPKTKLSGFDFSEKGVDYSKKLVRGSKVFVHNIYNKIGNKYDYIVCTEVIEHLVYPEKAIKNLLNAIKLDGKCLITVPNGRTDTLEEHINFWSPESWKTFVELNVEKGKYKYECGLYNEKTNYVIVSKFK